MTYRSLYFDLTQMNSNSFCSPTQDLADSINAGNLSDQVVSVTDSNFPKIISFTVPTIADSCTSQFFYTVD